MNITNLRKFFIIASSTILLSCGSGGGGGDGFIGAALVNIDASPRKLDPGDRMRVTIRLQEVHPDGILLKIRFPDESRYVPATSFLRVDGKDIDVDPYVNSQASDKSRFLVYEISEEDLGNNNSGILTFELLAVSDLSEGKVEVDPDVDDPAITNSAEFNIEEPAFSSEDDITFEIKN